MTDYLSCAETAKLVRAALRKAFPGARFTVRSSTFSGGASIGIGWTDGPQRAAVDKVAQPYRGAGFDGTTDLKTTNRHWLHRDGRAESFQSQIGHSWAQRTLDAGGAEVPAGYARDYRHGVASAAGEQLAGPDPDPASPAYQQGHADARKRLSDGARLVHFGADSIFTDRAFSDEYRGRLERQVTFLAGEAGSFDPDKRYGFGLAAGGRWFEGSGNTLARDLSEAGEDEVREATERKASRRAAAAVTRHNAEHAENPVGFYVSAKDGSRHSMLLGPYAAKEEAEAAVPLGSKLARTVDDRAVWYAYGVTKVTMPAGKDLPAGVLEPLVERQMTLAVPAPGVAPR
jgi:Large polyvalent protein associated domain 29